MFRIPRHSNLVNRSSHLNNGLISWWLCVPHLMGSGTLFDLMGKNHGTLNSMDRNSWISRNKNNGLLFDGSSSFINLGNTSDFTFGTNNFTISAWMQTNIAAGYKIALGKDLGSAREWVLGVSATSSEKWQFLTLTNSPDAVVLTSTSTVDTLWHHITVTKISTSSYLYVDGILEATDSSSNINLSNDSTLFLGKREFFGFPQYWDGGLDDIRIYNNRGLLADEVYMLYIDSLLGYPKTLNTLMFNHYTPPIRKYLFLNKPGNKGLALKIRP